jgi:hypothetical protein
LSRGESTRGRIVGMHRSGGIERVRHDDPQDNIDQDAQESSAEEGQQNKEDPYYRGIYIKVFRQSAGYSGDHAVL